MSSFLALHLTIASDNFLRNATVPSKIYIVIYNTEHSSRHAGYSDLLVLPF